MARYEKELAATAAEPLGLRQSLELLGEAANAGGGGDEERRDAVACFVAGAEGWEEALKRLGGAFAREERGLKDDQSECPAG